MHSKRTAVDDNPFLYSVLAFLYSVLGCAYERKAQSLQWMELIGVVIKSIVIVKLVGLAKCIIKPDFQQPGQICCAY